MDSIVILCTTNSQESALNIAQTLVKNKLCACVNIIPKVYSVYSWKDKIETDEEYLMLIKTKKDLFEQVNQRIQEIHPYEVPEVISLDITEGSKSYLDWIVSNVK